MYCRLEITKPEKKPGEIRVGGIIQNVTKRYDKKNRPWAIVELNGSGGKADVFVFNDVFEDTKDPQVYAWL